MEITLSRQIFENILISKFNENPFLEAELFHVYGRTDRHHEANSYSSQFCERPKYTFLVTCKWK